MMRMMRITPNVRVVLASTCGVSSLLFVAYRVRLRILHHPKMQSWLLLLQSGVLKPIRLHHLLEPINVFFDCVCFLFGLVILRWNGHLSLRCNGGTTKCYGTCF
eukprot:GHVU01005270.1.p3 GENE.GHVU01005270.1~~GHVU01005270.1.p3  ORF type:complete len:104 (+),score=2.93 GHVU01005270.1:124-435(+)